MGQGKYVPAAERRAKQDASNAARGRVSLNDPHDAEMGRGPVLQRYPLHMDRAGTEPENFDNQRVTDIELSPHAQGDWKTPGKHAVGAARDAHDMERALDRNGLKISPKK